MVKRHSNHGKWSQAGVPHKGWEFVTDYDSCENGEELHVVCGMCESQPIRYVQIMRHPDYPEPLECGLQCAGRMSDDHVSTEARDKAMKSRARAKKTREAGADKSSSAVSCPDKVTSMIAEITDALSESGRETGRFNYKGLRFTVSEYGGISVWTSWLPGSFLQPDPRTAEEAKSQAIAAMAQELLDRAAV